MSERPTKERILDAAEQIMLERSFHSVGLNQILSAVKVPKGSFYHYFESKEQFGVELLRHYANGSTEWKRKILIEDRDTEPNPIQRLLTFFNFVIGKVQENEGKCPCLIQKLAAEVADFSEPMRDELARSFADSVQIMQQLMEEAVEKGALPESFDPVTEASFVQDLWTGAQQRASIFRSTDPLHQAVEIIRLRLR